MGYLVDIRQDKVEYRRRRRYSGKNRRLDGFLQEERRRSSEDGVSCMAWLDYCWFSSGYCVMGCRLGRMEMARQGLGLDRQLGREAGVRGRVLRYGVQERVYRLVERFYRQTRRLRKIQFLRQGRGLVLRR